MLIGLGLIALCFFAIYAIIVAQVGSRASAAVFFFPLLWDSALISMVFKRSVCRL
jgi:hypothetical protein